MERSEMRLLDPEKLADFSASRAIETIVLWPNAAGPQANATLFSNSNVVKFALHRAAANPHPRHQPNAAGGRHRHPATPCRRLSSSAIRCEATACQPWFLI